jgi:hypothetical protein
MPSGRLDGPKACRYRDLAPLTPDARAGRSCRHGAKWEREADTMQAGDRFVCLQTNQEQ